VDASETVAVINSYRQLQDNIRRAHEIREVYQHPSQQALDLAARTREAAEALMDDEARTRVAAGLPAWGPIDSIEAARREKEDADGSAPDQARNP
jgi:hypothetical protein